MTTCLCVCDRIIIRLTTTRVCSPAYIKPADDRLFNTYNTCFSSSLVFIYFFLIILIFIKIDTFKKQLTTTEAMRE